MRGRLEGKVAVVTGACGGIGKAVVERFSQEGAMVVLADLSEESLRATVSELRLDPERCMAVQTDISQEKSVTALIEAAVERFGALDVMVNNAGIVGAVAGMEEFPAESMEEVLRVNVMGTFFGIKHALRRMQRQGSGVIINMSSVAGHKGQPNTAAYVASKHAVIGLTRAAAAENAARGIRVCAVCPAPVATPMMQRIEDGMMEITGADRRSVHAMLADLPSGRYAAPGEVAAAVVFLASDEASFISGSSVFVDGGFLA